MLLVITKTEKQFIVDTLRECARACDDTEYAVEECLEILESLDEVGEDVYG